MWTRKIIVCWYSYLYKAQFPMLEEIVMINPCEINFNSFNDLTSGTVNTELCLINEDCSAATKFVKVRSIQFRVHVVMKL